MKTKFFSTILCLCLTINTFAETSYTITGSGNNLTLTITGTGNMRDYSYPEASSWYSQRANIKTLIINEGVTSIGQYAFYGCSGLTSVTIPSFVTSVGEHAFSYCSGLTSVILEDGTTPLLFKASQVSPNAYVNSAFGGCPIVNLYLGRELSYYSDSSPFKNKTTLTNLTISNSVTSIENSSFYGCSGLTSVIIPNSVTLIGQCAFYGCSGLTSVTIPNSVTSIGNAAFYGCSSLTSVTIPNSVTSIGVAAFRNTGLTSVTIPNSVTIIEDLAFAGCTGLTSVTIGNSVSSIRTSAFSGCYGLTSVTIPNSVTSIGSFAFELCSSLTSVTIPSSVTSIGQYAFEGCIGLTNVILEDGTTTLSFTDSPLTYTFRKCPIETLYLGRNCSFNPHNSSPFLDIKTLTTLTVGNSVTSIGPYAFWGCTGLTTITIGNSVNLIDDYAFYSCSRLTSVTIFATVPPDNYGIRSSNATFYVPCSSLSAYKAADYWKNYNYGACISTPIDEINQSEISVVAISGGISVATPQAAEVTVVSLAGRQVYQAHIAGSREIALPQGVYVVKIGGESRKIIVK